MIDIVHGYEIRRLNLAARVLARLSLGLPVGFTRAAVAHATRNGNHAARNHAPRKAPPPPPHGGHALTRRLGHKILSCNLLLKIKLGVVRKIFFPGRGYGGNHV